jgi:hypothetical protein
VSREEEYLRNAKDAQEWADRAVTAEDREGWLRIAQGWLNLFTRWTSETSKSRRTGEQSEP